ncbi:SDR family NAD(P)-dependent oxidoreductase [Streptomyces abyssomicinicus]|uniref:SDR family NAD(P)-dependent oxidoreductase n=1 Tax=Streptomyces abyssomicinicus TaxID=574929 RepID=UPI00124F7F8B|nr:glucose 1-dehydrogenase [Streptomyces abyssomicinicus]
MSPRLTGRVIAVTGAGSGLGAGFARALAREGAHVAVLDIDGSAIEATVEDIVDAGGTASGHHADVRSREQVATALHAAVAVHGRLDVMINNAGISIRKPFMETTEDDFRRIHDINVTGVLVGMQEAARVFLEQGGGGKIINLCSAASRKAGPDFSAYAASKFAVLSLVQSGARALAGHGITVNGIAPGVIDTGLWDSVTDRTAALMDQYAHTIPLGRVSTAEDLAPTAVFLSAPDSDYMTGQVVAVDGGMQMV